MHYLFPDIKLVASSFDFVVVLTHPFPLQSSFLFSEEGLYKWQNYFFLFSI